MTNEQIRKQEIQAALAKIPDSNFLETATDLLAVLGYRSERTEELWETVDEFIEELPARNQNTHTEGEFRAEVESVELVIVGLLFSNDMTLKSDRFSESNPCNFNLHGIHLSLCRSW